MKTSESQATDPKLDELCINTIRFLALDAVQKANSGHPGTPMGAAPMAYVLWDRFLKHNPGDPGWADRDRFILSPGHASALLYALLHLSGYDLPMEELKRFRQWGSKTPGHPEYGLIPGVEMTTGPLGQGSPMAWEWPSPSGGWPITTTDPGTISSTTIPTLSSRTVTCRKG